MTISCDIDRGTPVVIDARGGCYPGMHIAKVTFGVASDSPDVVLGSTTTATSDGTTGDFILFYVSPDVVIDNVRVLINDAFENATTTGVVSIGTSSDLDGFMVSSDLNLDGTTGTMVSMVGTHGSTGGGAAPANVGGLLVNSDLGELDSDGYAEVVVSVSAAAFTVGKATVYLYWHGAKAVG